ncbi:hypothetical protein GCM10007920_33240 [Ciceribacter naphthalenivorans]|uniref:Uncharacterized protein n=2 Tax=Alphaproteobacteria TaxID=28211 RepID=A0A512HKE6_9HYPH|nr:hypothetical protein RNA01_28430 [Ciceribacter naphthalenivorans]GLR23533.1 hypothetical protein GCM10007920_33240 [Ciceribacter naphthalenivorans]GLT06389.1 hypothetical protein GCM10007926_33240 [Sphingomonas psychrolutea]
MQVTLIDPGREQGIALQGNRLPLITARYPHVANQHARQTSNWDLPHSLTFRQRLSRKKSPALPIDFHQPNRYAEIICFPLWDL